MKNLRIIAAGLFLAAASQAPAFSQDETIAMDEELVASFDSYESYSFTSDVSSTDSEDWLNDAVLHSNIKDAISYELSARGYDMNGESPDMLINFKVFEEPTEFQGYTGYEEIGAGEEVREPEDVKTYNLEAGTLLVQILDKNNGTIVWQGYSSGLMTDDNMFDKDPNKIKEAVHQIFSEYNYETEDSKMKNKDEWNNENKDDKEWKKDDKKMDEDEDIEVELDDNELEIEDDNQ